MKDAAGSTVDQTATLAIPEPKAMKYNGTIVPEEPSEIGYGEWMLVTRRNQNRNKPNGPIQNGMQRDARAKTQNIPKESPSSVEKGKENGSYRVEPGNKKGALT